MKLPTQTRDEIRDELWGEADLLDWDRLSPNEKSRMYTIWTNSPKIGGRLSGYVDPRRIRVYIKDTLLKPYTRERLDDFNAVAIALGLGPDPQSNKTYIKPHGRRLADGREIAWSRASEWKATLMALHERCFETKSSAYAAVFLYSSAKLSDHLSQRLIEDAARRLGIERVVWLN